MMQPDVAWFVVFRNECVCENEIFKLIFSSHIISKAISSQVLHLQL
jgi:hypothetical protein